MMNEINLCVSDNTQGDVLFQLYGTEEYARAISISNLKHVEVISAHCNVIFIHSGLLYSEETQLNQMNLS